MKDADLKDYVTNQEAFEKYQKLMNNPFLKKYVDKPYVASDGTKINLMLLPHSLRAKIEHLPQEEQTKILGLKKAHIHLYNTAMGFKGTAFAYNPKKVGKPGVGNISMLEGKKDEIIELLGRMYTIGEVHQIITKDWKMPVSLQMFNVFAKKYNEIIRERTEVYKQSFEDVRLAVKRSRLDELTWMYVVHKTQYQKHKYGNDMRVLLSVLEQIRKEVEGDTLKVEGDIGIKIETTVNTHLQKEVFRELNIQMIIIAKVAARMGADPMMLYKSLVESYYSKYTGINGKPEFDEEIAYPSTEIYDWVGIREANDKVNEAVEVNILAKPEQTDEQKKKDEEKKKIKSKLLGLLSKEKADLHYRKSLVEKSILDGDTNRIKE